MQAAQEFLARVCCAVCAVNQEHRIVTKKKKKVDGNRELVDKSPKHSIEAFCTTLTLKAPHAASSCAGVWALFTKVLHFRRRPS